MHTQIQYTGFQLKPRGREYCYRVLDPKAEAREFTLTIPKRAFEDRHFPYQDAADLCYQKLQRDLLTETEELPLPPHIIVSDQELDDYLAKHRPAKRRTW